MLACAAALTACDSGGADTDRTPEPVAIDAQVVRGHLRALQRIADRSGGNRSAGTAGYRRSARYVAGALRRAGWTVRLRPFRYPWWSERESTLRIDPGGPLVHGRDFRPMLFSGSGSADGPLRPAGNGCSAAELAGVQPGDVVLAQPLGCLFRVKAAAAQAAGAGGLLIADPARRGSTSTATLTAPGTRLPVAIVRRAVADAARRGRARAAAGQRRHGRAHRRERGRPERRTRQRRGDGRAGTSTRCRRAPGSTTTGAAWRPCSPLPGRSARARRARRCASGSGAWRSSACTGRAATWRRCSPRSAARSART